MNEAWILRLGCIAAGAWLMRAAYSLILSAAPLTQSPSQVILMVVLGALAFLLLGIGGGAFRLHPAACWLILGAALIELLARTSVTIASSSNPALVTAHSGLYTDSAAAVFLQGHHPYRWDYSGLPIYLEIPLLMPGDASLFPYPPLGILLVAALQGIGLPGMFTLSLLTYTAALVIIFWRTPSTYRPLILIPVFAADSLLFSQFIQAGSLAMLAGTLLTLAAAWWSIPQRRGIAVGLACAAHPMAWWIFPFLLIRIGFEAEQRLRRISAFILWSGGTFLLINLPFLGQAWWAAMTSNFDYYSPWFGRLLPYQIAAFLVMLWLYLRHTVALRSLCWIAPLIITGDIYGVFPALVEASLLERAKATLSNFKTTSRFSWAITLTGAILIPMAVILVVPGQKTSITVEVLYPLKVDNAGHIQEMQIKITNWSGRTVAPHFSVIPLADQLALPWQVVAGSDNLADGREAIYTIRVAENQLGFYSAAYVVIEDNASHLHHIEAVGLYDDYGFPDVLFNANYHLWNVEQDAPLGWIAVASPKAAGTIAPIMLDGREALSFSIDPRSSTVNRLTLETYQIFPETPLGIWLYAPDPAQDVLYGVEIETAGRHLLFLFGSEAAAPTITDNTYIEHQVVPSGEWVFRELDLVGAFDYAGWPLPPLQRSIYRGLDIDLALMKMRLMLVTRETPVEANFGEIVQPLIYIDPQVLMEAIFEDPGDYYLRLAERHRYMRNDHLAVAAYQEALKYVDPNSEAARFIAAKLIEEQQ